MIAGPVVLLLLGIVLVATAINGTSTGAFFGSVYSGEDPDLILGHPRVIRTDEWSVQSVWAISQVQRGLPETSNSFPGGMDATVPQDLPRADWSVVFRPHLWGFLFLDVDHAQAFKWWLPALGLLAACYVFAVSLLPRRPFLAAGLSLSFFLSPLIQWWFLQTTLWPPAWGFAVLAALIWVLRTRTVAPIPVWGAILAYLTPVMAMGIYVPYMQPVAIVAALGGVGLVIEALRNGLGWRATLARVGVVLAAGAVGAAVVVVWLLTRLDVVRAFLGTSYPGARSFPAGQMDLNWLASTFSSAFSRALLAGTWLGTNASEASSFFLAGVFLIPVLAWLTVVKAMRKERLPWLALGATAGALLILAFAFVPGWDAVARLLGFSQVLQNRLRIGLGFASTVVVVCLVRDLDQRRHPGWIAGSAVGLLYVGSQIAIAAHAVAAYPGDLGLAQWWKYLAVGGGVAITLIALARPAMATAVMVCLGLLTTAQVNPLYQGVFDLRETEPGREIIAMHDRDPDSLWVGVGGRMTTALILEAGVTGLNGFQGAPSQQMWTMIDPQHQYEQNWNRLAGVSWTPGAGEPVVSNPFPDQILVTFDACSRFAQDNVTYVVSDATVELPGACLTRMEDASLASGEIVVWKVTSP